MKKFAAFLLCVALCVCLAGCRSHNTEAKNEEAKEALTKVLEREETFAFKSPINGRITEERLDKLHFTVETSAFDRFWACAYTFVDCDSDGIEEIALLDAQLEGLLILRYEEGKVYGYHIDRSVCGPSVKTDGSVRVGPIDDKKELYTLTFDGYSFEMIPLAHKDDATGTYQLNGEDTSKEAAEAYIAEWEKNTTAVTWVDMAEVWEDMVYKQ